MTYSAGLTTRFLPFGVPLILIAPMIFLASSTAFQQNPDMLSMGITIDLILTGPLLYFLLIRKRDIPKITVVPLFIIGLVVATLILPKENQFLLSQVKTWVLPIVELTVVTIVILKVRKVVKHYKSNPNASVDFFSALRSASAEILPKPIVYPFATEIAVFYYCFISWKKRTLKPNEFSYHKKTSARVLFTFLIFLIIIETFVLHLLLAQWSTTAAWILTAISIYSGLQILGIAKSMSKRPIAAEADGLKIRYGLLNETTIDWKNVKSIELTNAPIVFDKNCRKLSPLDALENHNVLIKLKQEGILFGLYGFKRRYTSLAIHLDTPETFKNATDRMTTKPSSS